jgi:hypothetical protein
MSWNVSGTYFESCNCEAACPCVFLSPPTDGECTAILGWHIDSGEFNGLSIDGLNVSLAVYAGGHMADGGWRVALYVDDRSSEEQVDALGAIFSGAAGGHPAVLAGFIGEVMGVAPAAITMDIDDSSLSFKVGEIADVQLATIEGQGGALVSVGNHPLAVAPGNDLVVARSERLTYKDHGYEWEITGRNGFFSPFQYEG